MRHIQHRIAAILAAAAMSCCTVPMEALPLTAFAQQPVQVGQTDADDTLVPVIVLLHDSAVLADSEAENQGAAFIETPRAKQMANTIQRKQMEAERQLRALYPELQIRYRYHLVLNGFSCELPKNLIETAKGISEIRDIEPIQTHEAPKPKLYDAPDMSHAGAFYDQTGSYGEGEVICVIDTEMDTTHPMFGDLTNVNVKLTPTDVETICPKLSVSVDPTQAYRNSKVPFAFDYSDESPYDVTDPDDYHGTHVCGIAAGNAVDDVNGQMISGLARDAQIVFMKIFTYFEDYAAYTYTDDVLAAALEDSISLKADVINMSLGSNRQCIDDLVYTEIIDNLSSAGVVVCAAAGNDDNRVEGDGYPNAPQRVDCGTVGEPAAIGNSFCVASADNAYETIQCFTLTDDGNPITFLDSTYEAPFIDRFASQTIEYEYCGLGAASDFEGKSLTGKLAFIDRGELYYEEKAKNAAAAGAIGMIVCDNVPDADLVYMEGVGEFPSIFISMADGELLKNAADKRITIPADGISRVPVPPRVSNFSSYGLGESLTLKPEIMGIGGNVISAAYDGNFSEMSGTSMATPYVAGATACLDSYLRSQGLELTGMDKSRFIRNLLMNSASLYTDDNGLYVTPRQQGAGLVSLTNAITDKVLMTGTQDKAAIELLDHLGDTLEFDVVLNNISTEDVTFTGAKVVMLTDATAYDDYFEKDVISGTQALTCEADVSSLLSTAAGESRTEHITVNLDPAQLQQIGSVFTNGFFIDGYIVLEGADNCCDISIPIVGFHGDWAAAPIFDIEGIEYPIAPLLSTSYCGMYGDTEFGKLLRQYLDYIKAHPVQETTPFLEDYINAVLAETAEQEGAIVSYDEILRDMVYVSPNNDGLADDLAVSVTPLREASVSDLNVFDASGKQVISYSDRYDVNAGYSSLWMAALGDNGVSDGSYTARLDGYIYYPGAENTPQTLDIPFVVDTKAPEVTQNIVEEDGRTILELTIKDDSLDSILVLGNGRGGEVGNYDPADLTSGKELYGALRSAYFQLLSSEEVYANTLTQGLPWISYALGKGMNSQDTAAIADYSLSDILLPQVGQDGYAHVRYDITDMTDYHFTVLDKAYNGTQVTNMDTIFNGFRPGVWRATGKIAGYYYFETENSGTVLYQTTGLTDPFKFSIEGIGPNFKYGNSKTPNDFDARVVSPDSVVATFYDEDGVPSEMYFTYLGNITLEEAHVYTNDQLSDMAITYFQTLFDRTPDSTDVTNMDDGSALVNLYFFNEDGEMTENYTYQVDPRTGAGVDYYNLFNPVDLTDPTAVPYQPSASKGDVDGDGWINASDAAEILIAAAKLGAGAESGLDETQTANADVNNDGELNAADATIILVYAAAVGSGAENVTIEDFIG